ncbi:MAG: translocation/assembly module TamB domain-containing protein [Lentimicrobiaceae bacterium]|nr:translocation/assembly module TamB domain-containing protein [Lentimicrobiaceae bacterium]
MIKTLLGILLFFVVLVGLLQVPKVQTYLASRTATFLSARLHTQISIGELSVTGFRKVKLKNVLIIDLHKDTLLASQSISLKIGNVSIRTRHLKIRKIVIDHAGFSLIKYKDEEYLNLQFLIDFFSSGTKPTTSETKAAKPWKISCDAIDIKGSKFEYYNQSKKSGYPGMNYEHLAITHLNLSADHLSVVGDTISGDILHLSCRERCGFTLEHLSAKARVSSREIFTQNLVIKTPDSDLLLDLSFSYPNYYAFNYFVDSVKINSTIFPSDLNLNDIAYFAPAMKGMDNTLSLEGIVKGEVSNLKTKNFLFGMGETTRFKGNISMTGLPNIKETFIHCAIDDFYTNVADLQKFKLPGENNTLAIPEKLLAFGDLEIKGLFTGFYNDFVSNAVFNTELGKLSTDISVKNNLALRTLSYNGQLTAKSFDLGTLMSAKEYFGKLNTHLELEGSGVTTENLNITMNGTIDSLNFKGLNYSNIIVKGDFINRKFNGVLNVDDKNIGFDFTGLVDFNDTLPVFNFVSNIQHAKLNKLQLTQRDSLSELNTSMACNFRGNTIDNLQGELRFDNTSYTENGKIYHMEHLGLKTENIRDNNRTLVLASDFVDATFSGKFTFLNFYRSFNSILNHYLPSVILRSDTLTDASSKQNFVYYILLKNTSALSELFLPQLIVTPQTKFEGTYDSQNEELSINGSAKEIVLNGIKFRNWTLNGKSKKKEFIVNTGCKYLVLKEPQRDDSLSLGLDSLYLEAEIYGDSINYRINWDDYTHINRNKGQLSGYANFTRYPQVLLRIMHGEMLINDSLWTVAPDNIVMVDSNSINFYNLTCKSKSQSLGINGIISPDPLDRLNISIHDFNIDYLDFITGRSKLDIDGILDGNVALTDVYHATGLLCNVKLRKFCFSKEELGDLMLNSSWDNEQKTLDINATIEYTGNVGISYPLTCKGTYTPGKSAENLNLDINLKNLKVKTLTPFVKGIFSDLKGYASGDFRLKGTTEKPELTGKLHLMRSEFRVDYLNVLYSFAHDVNFDNNRIWFNDLVINDTLGNTGVCSGKILHDNFANFRLDLLVKTKKLAGLHTEYYHNSQFYGNAFVGGDVAITGPVNNISISVKVASEKNTELFIPVNLTADVSENNFIRFVNASDTVQISEFTPEITGVNLDMDVNVTPDAGIKISLPMQMGNISVTGSGNLKMGVNPAGDFRIFGDYTMNEGTYQFSLQNMINRQFSIEKGGMIKWNGDPADANINLSAVYSLKASLSGLPIDSSLIAQRIPVDCILILKNKLTNPDISFRIRLPNSDEQIAQQVFNVIDTTDQVEMNKQMISLLVLNSFSYSAMSSSIASSVGSSGFELLSNQFSNWLSQISKDFDIGVNYHPGDKISSEQLELALSTQLFNNRVLIDGNFGVNGTQNYQGATSNNNNAIIGDVNVEVKITKDGRLRAKAYNKSNAYDLFNDNSLYTQGVGIFYRKEFDRLGDLFRRKKSKLPEKI